MRKEKLYTKYLITGEIEAKHPFMGTEEFKMEVKISDEWITFKNVEKNNFDWRFRKSSKKTVKTILNAMLESFELDN